MNPLDVGWFVEKFSVPYEHVEWLHRRESLWVILLPYCTEKDQARLERLGALPKPRLLKQSWSTMVKGAPKADVVTKKYQYNTWEISGLEEDFIARFPARTKLDLRLRRTRARDLWIHLRKLDKTKKSKNKIDTKKIKNRMLSLQGWDYISALNLGWAMVLMPDFYDLFDEAGAFDKDISHYIRVAKHINDQIKTKGVNIENPQWYVEGATLTGYRNPPFPGFDTVEESRKLAAGGNQRFMPPGITFKQAVAQALTNPIKPVDSKSFKEWLEDGDWLTSGASSAGKIEIDTPEGIVNVKIRKNLLPDVWTVEELVEKCSDNLEQTNKTIEKAELGKIRIAVSSDVWTYLEMSYLLYFVNGAYGQWFGSTLDETAKDQMIRMEITLDELVYAMGLPYDYDGFDHQPETTEIQDILDKVWTDARSNVKNEHLAEYDRIKHKTISQFKGATLSVKGKDGKITIFSVTGGIMSGLRVTSLIGNAWNSVLTWVINQLLPMYHMEKARLNQIRGDDSNIIARSYATLAATHALYAAMGAVAGIGKFSIQLHQTEFLRIWYDEKCIGYPMRAIPGLVQRKPWANQPWTDVGVMTALYENTRILKRRGLNIEPVWETLKGVWCQLHQIPKKSLSSPRATGGLGIEPSQEISKFTPALAPPLKPPITPIRKTIFRELRAQRLVKEIINMDIEIKDLKDVADTEAAATIVSDDIPQIARPLRNWWNQRSKKSKKTDLVNYDYKVTRITVPTTIRELYELQDSLFKVPDYGSEPQLRVVLQTLRIANGAGKKIKVSEYLRMNDTGVWDKITKWRGYLGLAGAMDWIIGDVSVPPTEIHPLLSGYVKANLVWAISQKPKPAAPLAILSHVLTPMWTGQISESYIAKRLYSW